MITDQEYEAAAAAIAAKLEALGALMKTQAQKTAWTELHHALRDARDRMDADRGIVRPRSGGVK